MGDNIISEIVQKQTNDGSEEYIIKESDITNELVIKPSGEILVDGNLAIAINATDVCSVENADLSINSGIGTMANAVKYETTSPLVGSSTQYNTLSGILQHTLTDKYLDSLGYVDIAKKYEVLHLSY